MLMIAAIALISLLEFSVNAEPACDKPINRLIFKIPGNVSITGIVHAHGGENCDLPVASGLEYAAAAIWTVSTLNEQKFLPGIQIGLAIFDGCDDKDELKKTYVQSLLYQNCIKPDVPTLGTFTNNEIRNELETLAASLNESICGVSSVIDSPSLLTMVTQLIRQMSFTTIHRVIADSQSLLNEFGRKTAEEGICVYDQVLIDDSPGINNEVLHPPNSTDFSIVTKGAPVIFLSGTSRNIRQLFQKKNMKISSWSDLVWIIAPSDSILDISYDELPNRTFILSAVLPKTDSSISFLNDSEVIEDPLNHREPTRSPLFLAIASTILKVLNPLASIRRQSCKAENDTCLELFEFLDNFTQPRDQVSAQSSLTTNDIKTVLQDMKIPLDDEMFLFNVIQKGKSDDIAVFEIFDHKTLHMSPTLLIFKESRRRRRSIVRVGITDIERWSKINASVPSPSTTEPVKLETIVEKKVKEFHPCYEEFGNVSSDCGICFNFVKYLSKVAQEKQMEGAFIEVRWRFETWVIVNASIAAIGIICSIAIFTFIVTRICLGDVLEGSPALSFFLLIAITLSYIATLPFSFDSTGTEGDPTLSSVICDLRVAGPPLSYSILFSIMFSRSLMLAASDQDGGFMSHVNGYLQAVLIFFVCSVQFGLSLEYWLFNSFLLSETTSCDTMYSSNRFIFLLFYDFFILLLLLSVIPFMIRAKRNYKEGTFFSVAIILIFLIWITWVTLFYVLPPSYKDATVMLGLTGSATAIIVSVFIPRTYLMTTSIVRDRIVNTLPPLMHSESQFRSTNALYDTLNLANKTGTHNPNFYSINPTDSSPGTPQIHPGEYYSSDGGLKVPTLRRTNDLSKQNLRPVSPENSYQTFDSPVRSPRHVTRF